MTYKTEPERLAELLDAVEGLDLAEDERRLVEHLAGWPPSATDRLVSILRKARDGARPADAAVKGRRLCAHADAGGEGMHWLEPGEKCRAGDADGGQR